MKPGTLITRVVMVLLFLTVLAYLGFSILQGMEQSVETAAVYTYTAEDRTETTGYIARAEQPVSAQSGLVDVTLSEGETVARGGVIARVYADAAALERQAELEALALEIEQLRYVTGRSLESADTAELNTGIVNSITALKAAVARGDLSELERETSELKNLIFRRDYTYNGETSLDVLLAEKTAAYEALRQQAVQSTTTVRAEAAGTFSGQVDGYEGLLTPEALGQLTPSDVDSLSAGVPAVSDGAWLGKIITDARWYFVCNLTEAEARAMGDKVKLRFTKGYTDLISMKVERVSAAENGKVTVVLSTNRCLAETTLLRRQTADVIYSSATGLRIPKRAIRLEEKTVTDPETKETSTVQQTGVYCVTGLKADWKPVNILWEGEDFYLVEAALPENSELRDEAQALHAGDAVIVKGEDLYDGKVVG